jgi:hypothetical protein
LSAFHDLPAVDALSLPGFLLIHIWVIIPIRYFVNRAVATCSQREDEKMKLTLHNHQQKGLLFARIVSGWSVVPLLHSSATTNFASIDGIQKYFLAN